MGFCLSLTLQLSVSLLNKKLTKPTMHAVTSVAFVCLVRGILFSFCFSLRVVYLAKTFCQFCTRFYRHDIKCIQVISTQRLNIDKNKRMRKIRLWALEPSVSCVSERNSSECQSFVNQSSSFKRLHIICISLHLRFVRWFLEYRKIPRISLTCIRSKAFYLRAEA